MDTIVDKITELIKEMLQGWVLTNLDTMFTDVNTKVGTIASEVSRTPSAWNAGIFNMIKTLSRKCNDSDSRYDNQLRGNL